jgi:hypothetical protein
MRSGVASEVVLRRMLCSRSKLTARCSAEGLLDKGAAVMAVIMTDAPRNVVGR